MLNTWKSLLLIFGMLFLLGASSVSAQGALHCRDGGFNNCVPDFSVDPNPDCNQGNGEEDPCPNGDYNACCTLAGSFDSGGILLACNNIACTIGTPTPAPLCDPGDECINATQADCESSQVNGESRACSDINGVSGNCCVPPPQTNSPCTQAGGLCRPPNEQTVPGECEWNEINIQRECLSSQFPNGTICCDPAPIAKCGVGQLDDGYCAPESECTSPHSGLTDCGETGEICCLPSPTYVNNQKIFCDSNGDPTGDPITGEIRTAFGCINVDEVSEFTSYFLIIGLGIGGAIALLLIGVAGMLIKFSGGNPERLQAGKELLFAAITGLLLIIFSVYFLRLVGADILGIEQLIATPTPTP